MKGEVYLMPGEAVGSGGWSGGNGVKEWSSWVLTVEQEMGAQERTFTEVVNWAIKGIDLDAARFTLLLSLYRS